VDDPESFVERRLAALVAGLQSNDEGVRWDAASDIKDMGPIAVAAVPAFINPSYSPGA